MTTTAGGERGAMRRAGPGRASVRLLGLAGWLLASSWTTQVSAAAPPLSLPGDHRQHPLTVQVVEGRVQATTCPARSPCPAGQALQVPIGGEARQRLGQAELRALTLEDGRSIAELRIPGRRLNERWVLLLAATPASEPPRVLKLLAGWLGRPRGQPGEQHHAVLLRESAGRGQRLIIGRRYEHATVCGRPATIAARQLEPTTLRWRPSGARSLTAAQQAQAVPLTAHQVAGGWPANRPELLHAVVASSAVGRQTAPLTDGDLATAWSEDRPGPGSGEFVVMSASTAVPIEGFEFALRPTGSPSPEGAAPKRFWIATTEQLYEIALPQDPWQQPAATRFSVALPEPVRSDCVALVLGEAYVEADRQRTSVAELRATTSFDGAADWQPLVGALDGPRDRAQAAGALLSRSRAAAIRATIAGFPTLGPAGRRRALEVISAGACQDVVDFYVAQLRQTPAAAEGERRWLAEQARGRLRACDEIAADALKRSVDHQRLTAEDARATGELALVAPASAVETIVEVLHRADDSVRRTLRSALSRAGGLRRARRAVEGQLALSAFAARPLVTRIDLLRALGPQLATLRSAPAALQQVVSSDRTFRTRYLLQIPAGHIARGGDPGASELLQKSILADPSPHVRAQAARAAAALPSLRPALGRALQDGAPRVRQGALAALAAGQEVTERTVERRITGLLDSDPWTFVRQAAAEALGAAQPNARSEAALVRALEDESPHVRRGALLAMGRRGVDDSAPFVRTVADDAQETTRVRVAAINALGALCDDDAVDLLTKLAHRAAAARLPYDRPLGLASLAALGRIHPSDLRERLAPLIHPRAPASIRQLARATLRTPGSCR